MSHPVYFLVNIDTDPDPENTPRDDAKVLTKYRTMQGIVNNHAGGKGAICVQTSPMYRDRFLGDPFVDFWREWAAGGGDLVLHPEEDLYATPETRRASGTHYDDIGHMEPVIVETARIMADQGLAFTAYKGGYHGLTTAIAGVVKKAGIGIDLSCAPDIDWPIKEAHWRGAPTTAYYMSAAACAHRAAPDEDNPLFEIPFGWDGQASETTRRHLLNEHYLVNEFSTFEAMARVWDAIVDRAAAADAPQTVSLLCHTYTMADGAYRDRLARTLDYMCDHGGTPVTASEAKQLFDGA